MSKKIIKRIYNVVIILLFLGAIGWCFSHFYHGSDVAYTDDAQVNRHITPINTRVPGFIKEIRFNDYQHVKKGDTLVIIEDAEFRLHVAQAEARLEIFQYTLFPNALDGILHCCPCYIQQFGNLPNCHPHLTMMWGVDDHIFLYCYHLSFHTLPFIVLVLSLQTFPNVNSSMLFIC